eukprot:Gregarina_sp_Poly_1__1990@NODE_1521_length_3935_cov_50_029214_g642_i1_p1_GENE_NODE_1521_length_3935_cov_50_029214_g642_i1NODE_1521_length_3935_cov_50_029214_g642_i1_p1_ORF_typecomplete_len1020_score178_51_NODE_1521_length_3935_cov_50_029214_g642_i14873546
MRPLFPTGGGGRRPPPPPPTCRRYCPLPVGLSPSPGASMSPSPGGLPGMSPPSRAPFFVDPKFSMPPLKTSVAASRLARQSKQNGCDPGHCGSERFLLWPAGVLPNPRVTPSPPLAFASPSPPAPFVSPSPPAPLASTHHAPLQGWRPAAPPMPPAKEELCPNLTDHSSHDVLLEFPNAALPCFLRNLRSYQAFVAAEASQVALSQLRMTFSSQWKSASLSLGSSLEMRLAPSEEDGDGRKASRFSSRVHSASIAITTSSILPSRLLLNLPDPELQTSKSEVRVTRLPGSESWLAAQKKRHDLPRSLVTNVRFHASLLGWEVLSQPTQIVPCVDASIVSLALAHIKACELVDPQLANSIRNTVFAQKLFQWKESILPHAIPMLSRPPIPLKVIPLTDAVSEPPSSPSAPKSPTKQSQTVKLPADIKIKPPPAEAKPEMTDVTDEETMTPSTAVTTGTAADGDGPSTAGSVPISKEPIDKDNLKEESQRLETWRRLCQERIRRTIDLLRENLVSGCPLRETPEGEEAFVCVFKETPVDDAALKKAQFRRVGPTRKLLSVQAAPAATTETPALFLTSGDETARHLPEAALCAALLIGGSDDEQTWRQRPRDTQKRRRVQKKPVSRRETASRLQVSMTLNKRPYVYSSKKRRSSVAEAPTAPGIRLSPEWDPAALCWTVAWTLNGALLKKHFFPETSDTIDHAKKKAEADTFCRSLETAARAYERLTRNLLHVSFSKCPKKTSVHRKRPGLLSSPIARLLPAHILSQLETAPLSSTESTVCSLSETQNEYDILSIASSPPPATETAAYQFLARRCESLTEALDYVRSLNVVESILSNRSSVWYQALGFDLGAGSELPVSLTRLSELPIPPTRLSDFQNEQTDFSHESSLPVLEVGRVLLWTNHFCDRLNLIKDLVERIKSPLADPEDELVSQDTPRKRRKCESPSPSLTGASTAVSSSPAVKVPRPAPTIIPKPSLTETAVNEQSSPALETALEPSSCDVRLLAPGNSVAHSHNLRKRKTTP